MATLIKIDHSFIAQAEESIRFCSHCGTPANEAPVGERKLFERRVCESCEMGLLLRCTRRALPGVGAAFLIANHDLEITAVSKAAQVMLGSEEKLLGNSVLDVLSSPTGDDHLARAISRAAVRAGDPAVMPVRERSRKSGGMMAARIATCGPPRGALITVEPSEFGR